MVVGVLLSCVTAPPAEFEANPAPWEWDIDGCWAMDTGPECTVAPADSLTLWVGSEVAPTVDAPGIDTPTWEVAEDGFRATMTVSANGRWTIRTPKGALTLKVVTEPQPEVVARAMQLAGGGDMPSALAILEPAAASDDVDLKIAAGFRLATMGGMPMSTVEATAVDAEQWWWAARAALTSSYQHVVDDRDGIRALEAVARAREQASGPGRPLGFRLGYSLDYYEGRAFLTAGNHRSAMEALTRSKQQAERMGHTTWASHARQDVAESLIRLGETEDALALLRDEVEQLSSTDDPCYRAMTLNHYGWAMIQILETDHPEPSVSPVTILEEALAQLEEECDVSAYDSSRHRAQIHLNLALAMLQKADPDSAAFHLEASREAAPIDEPWMTVAEGRILLARGEARRALQLFEELEQHTPDQLELQWLALRWQGIAHEALDETDAAILDLERAQAFLFRQALLVPVYFGRSAYLQQRRDTAARLSRLLRSRGRIREALDTHRRSRASFLGALHQVTRLQSEDLELSREFQQALRDAANAEQQLLELRQPWEVPLDEVEAEQQRRAEIERRIIQAQDRGFAALGLSIRPERRRPDPGELFLGWFEEGDGWVGYAEDARDIVATQVRGSGPPPLDVLVRPFASQIERAKVVTLLLPESLGRSNVHRAPLEGRPLLASVPVRYAIDLAGPGLGKQSPTVHKPRALVVSDPRLDLALAREGAGAVAETLQTRGFVVEHRVGKTATRQAILEQLDVSDWLHYSGHGRAGPVWKSQLLVADGTIGVSDVLAVANTPRIAVINACGMADEIDGGVAMATAMVVAGTERALAPTTAVSDHTAEQLSNTLYRELASDNSVSRAYAASVVAIAGSDPEHEIWNYRLIRN